MCRAMVVQETLGEVRVHDWPKQFNKMELDSSWV